MLVDSHRRIIVLLAALVVAFASLGSVHGSDDDEEFKVIGAGKYLLTTSGGTEIDVKFAFVGKMDDGRARGRFRQSLEFQGFPIEFHGRVTCLSVDPVEGRVWVGGVVTRNNSVHPGFVGEIHEPGRDVWFRVLDTGKHSDEPDRTTFLGFEGGAGIPTSEEYCETQPWPDDNDRTHPVTRGQIKLKLDDD